MSEVKYLSSPELEEAAKFEAAHFKLPEDWRDGREVISGLTIDSPHSLDRDDAIALTVNADGGYELHVSIADVGSFLEDKQAILAHAQRQGWTKYRGDLVDRALIPPAISQDALSLLEGQERPVLTTHISVNPDGTRAGVRLSRDILIAKALSYDEINKTLAKPGADETAQEMRQFERVARLLFAARHQGAQDAVLEDEEGIMLAIDPRHSSSQLIVQEFMIASGAAIAHFMDDNRIPTLFRVHCPPEDTEIPYELLADQLFARYNTYAEPHRGLRLQAYTHVTSPLRRYVDLANHLNLIAHLEGRTPPITTAQLEYTGARLNRLEQSRRPVINYAERVARHTTTSRKMGRTTVELVQKMQTGTANDSEVAHVLFGQLNGTEDENTAARQEAARYVATRIHMARVVIAIALSRNQLTLEPADKRSYLVTDAQGNEYTYRSLDNPRAMAVEAARLIGRIADVDVTPEIPRRMTAEGRILEDGNHFLQKLHKEGRLVHRWYVRPPEEVDGDFSVDVVVVIDGTVHTRTATAKGRRTAERRAAAQLIEELDLIKNPPSLSKEAEYKRDPSKNPVVQLQARLQATRADQPAYTFEQVSLPPDQVNRCIATLTYNGTHYRVEADAKSNALAKQQAAEQLLEQTGVPAVVKQKKAK
ncbi:MAG TPA: RNB domain-containing ribonuclease [Candidatus Saccharimonadales bacterium]|nr:RNB domain-containing ribonuclease [Candidatus Saccharimonadales bacterium]